MNEINKNFLDINIKGNNAKMNKVTDKNIFLIGNFGTKDNLIVRYISNKKECVLYIEDSIQNITLNDTDWTDMLSFKDIVVRLLRTDLNDVMDKQKIECCMVFNSPIDNKTVFYQLDNKDEDTRYFIEDVKNKDNNFVLEFRNVKNIDSEPSFYLISCQDISIEPLYFYGKKRDLKALYNIYELTSMRERVNIIPFRKVVKKNDKYNKRLHNNS